MAAGTRSLGPTEAGAQAPAMASWEDDSLSRLLGRLAMARVRLGGAVRRADGEELRLGIFAKRATSDVELDSERTDILTLFDRIFGYYIKRDTDT